MVDTPGRHADRHGCCGADDPLVTPAAATRLLCALVAEIAGEQPDSARRPRPGRPLELARGVGDPVLIGLALHALCAVVSPELEPVERLEIGRELLEIGRQPGLAVFALIGHHSLVQVHGASGDHRQDGPAHRGHARA